MVLGIPSCGSSGKIDVSVSYQVCFQLSVPVTGGIEHRAAASPLGGAECVTSVDCACWWCVL